MHQVRYFLALCEDLNFTHAAERCHVAQPSLTRAIRQLEQEFGGALFHREQIVAALGARHRLASRNAVRVKDLDGECYIHRTNCEFARYADPVFQAQNVKCTAVYWSERDDWTLAMVAAGLGWAFMPANSVNHPAVVGLPIIEPEFWREVNLVTIRGRPHSPAVGALVREAMSTRWFGQHALAVERAKELPASIDDFAPSRFDKGIG
jgi:LysR family hydrogen peroxide-inducible transcriptional activator